MVDTPNLTMPRIVAAQSQKHVTHNEALNVLDAIVQLSVLDRDLTTSPSSPNEGDRYLVAASATGDWTGREGQVAAFQDGVWQFYPAVAGWRAWIADEDTVLVYDGSAWTDPPAAETAPQFGVNATADATNKLVVKSNAVLFDSLDVGEGGTGDTQHKINKEAAADTASVLFQTGFSGRAEFGLTGDDDFHMKVSPDGSTFHEGIKIDKDNGAVLKPKVPLFYGTPTIDYSGGGAPTGFMAFTPTSNNGNHWSTVNDRFTCPVDGYYLVAYGGTNVSGGGIAELYKNGALYVESGVHWSGTGLTEATVTKTQIVQCLANDYLQIYWRNGGGYKASAWGLNIFLIG